MKATYCFTDLAEATKSIATLEGAVVEVEVTLDILDELQGEPDGDGGLDGDPRTTWSPTGKVGRTILGDRPTAEYQEDLTPDSCWSVTDFEPRSFHWDIRQDGILEWVVE